MRRPFRTTRSDGRSDRRVIYELVQDAEVETVFSYEELISALQVGLPKGTMVDRDRVYRAVASANRTFLRERKRYLEVVENVGYRVIRADEQLPVSLKKKDRAQGYLQRGIELLRHVRLEELTEAQRTLHEGQLMIMSGLYHAIQESTRRHDRAESLIEDLLKSNRDIQDRLDRLESGSSR